MQVNTAKFIQQMQEATLSVPQLDAELFYQIGHNAINETISIISPNNFIIFLEGSEFSGKTSVMKELTREYENKGYKAYGFAFSDHHSYSSLKEVFAKYEISKSISLKEVITTVYQQYFKDVSDKIENIRLNSPSDQKNIFILDQYVWRTFVLQAYINSDYDDFIEVHNTIGSTLDILHKPNYERHLFLLEAKESVVMKRKSERLKNKQSDILDEAFTSKLSLVRQGYQTALQNESEATALANLTCVYSVDSSGSLSYALYQITKHLNLD